MGRATVQEPDFMVAWTVGVCLAFGARGRKVCVPSCLRTSKEVFNAINSNSCI